MQRHLRKAILMGAGGIVVGLLFVSTAGSIVATHKQIRQYLGMQDYVGVVPEHVAEVIEQRVPVGTPATEVRRFLDSRSIGTDEHSTCLASEDQRELTCLLGTDHHAWELLRESYAIRFEFDAAGKLQAVSADRHLNEASLSNRKTHHA